ncbi:MAG: UDP-N-acetylmuramoyl-L-alanyl-D-glutamate--2,6-diaminopimelate ligase [Dongiaceae bacterium]
MRLRALVGERNKEVAGAAGEIDVRGLSADSRRVEPGFLFAALPGAKTDGLAFVGEAARRGAVALLAPAAGPLPPEATALAVIRDENPRRRLALIAARFYRKHPTDTVAVTGTSGKTSVAHFTRQLWTLLGLKAASLGTLGIVAPGHDRDGALTTPDPVELHRVLAELANDGIDHLALEASSHGLDQFRLDGVRLKAAAFTNLTHEHLDYHGTLERYFAAKARLFTELLPEGGAAILNADSDAFGRLAAIAAGRRQRLLGYGRAGKEIRLLALSATTEGQRMTVELLGRKSELLFPVAGAFQAHNVLAALGLVIGSGADPARALAEVAHVSGVRGRIELVARHPNGAPIFVDYSHKPEALRTILAELRPLATHRLAVVFGCGGDRDRAKRPQMGRIAEELADEVIVTDDNPRTEDPAAIRAEILAACRNAREIGDRGEAIRAAVAGLLPGDVLVIAGKGHETGQTAMGVTHPFDDAEVARAAVAEIGDRS